MTARAERWSRSSVVVLPASLRAGSSRRITPRPLHWAYATDSIGAPMTALFQRLVGLRTGHAALRSDDIYPAAWPSDQGTFNAQGYGVDASRGLLIFHRWGPTPGGAVERFIVVVNFSGQDQWVDVPFPTNGAWTDQLAVPPAAVQVSGFWLRNWRVPSNYGRVFLQ